MELNEYFEEGKDKEEDVKKNLKILLNTFLKRNPKSDAAAIVTNEGLPIISSFSHQLDEVKISTMVATLFSLSNMALDDMILGEFKELFIRGKDGYIFIFQAGSSVIFMVSTTIDIKLRLIIFECKQICEKITELISR
ncbi:MAG: roadblock/LC7 domain-containing protein [Promethearchaeota archaeon]|jgi:predicted regulator of Ras-like GTPase activity (Roadblock/LC7/MglB family)